MKEAKLHSKKNKVALVQSVVKINILKSKYAEYFWQMVYKQSEKKDINFTCCRGHVTKNCSHSR